MEIETIVNAILKGTPTTKLGDNMPSIIGVMKDGKQYTHDWSKPFDVNDPANQPGYAHPVEVGGITLPLPIEDSITVDFLAGFYIHPYEIIESDDSINFRFGRSPI